ncbi:MAG: RHS repeat-associated core domain-containing protein, partial [Fulvivirga sp.]
MINISAAKWSHNVGLGNAALGDIDQKAYTYDYDPMYRLKTADHYEKTQSWSDVLSNNVSNLDYDLNGNIESISRKTSFGLDMDVLTYDYGTGTNRSNQLLSIDDDSENVLGFKDGHDHITTGVDDYSYDGNGSLKADNNKGITRISYNHLNLPDTVEFTGNKMIRFIYNSVGLKLAQENYENSSLKMRKDFAGEFYYENDTLRFISHQEGKAVPEIDGNYTYLYDIKDHLGNNRLSFTSKPKNWEFDASMEGENSSDEEMLFSNVQETRVTFNGANHTPGGNEVAQLNSTQPVGPAISLAVNPGDTITLETYAYYEGGSGYSSTTSLASFVAAVAGSFGGLNGGTIEQQATFDAFDNAYGGLGFGGTQEDNVPAAYLNYIFFDQNMNYRSSGFSQISIAANISHERVALEDLVMKEAGFIYAFVSMESAGGNVYFDDFKLYLRESRVVSASGYMPFGLTFDNYQRPTEPTQFFLFNGKERISDFDLNWDNFGARMYMADIGRWGVVDPMADKGPNLTPYRYAFNNPINVIDPDGRYEVNIGYGQSVDHKEFS